MLLRNDTRLPESLAVGVEEYSTGWSFIPGFTGASLDKAIEAAGWTFFFMAGQIHTRGFGLNAESRLASAVSKMTDAVTRERCNCLQITEATDGSFLGLHWTNLAAHARHVQQSRTFQGLSPLFASAMQRPAEGESLATKGIQTPVSTEGVLHV